MVAIILGQRGGTGHVVAVIFGQRGMTGHVMAVILEQREMTGHVLAVIFGHSEKTGHVVLGQREGQTMRWSLCQTKQKEIWWTTANHDHEAELTSWPHDLPDALYTVYTEQKQ